MNAKPKVLSSASFGIVMPPAKLQAVDPKVRTTITGIGRYHCLTDYDANSQCCALPSLMVPICPKILSMTPISLSSFSLLTLGRLSTTAIQRSHISKTPKKLKCSAVLTRSRSDFKLLEQVYG